MNGIRQTWVSTRSAVLMKIDFSQREWIDLGFAPYVLDPINENQSWNYIYKRESSQLTFSIEKVAGPKSSTVVPCEVVEPT